jgi:hypothetical protein
VGAFIAVRLSGERLRGAGLAVVAFMILATGANLLVLPHPGWVWPVALGAIAAAGAAAAWAAASRRQPA